MKKWTLAIAALAIAVLVLGAPVRADSFGVSPTQVELEVPAEGEASVEFTFYDFTGDIRISTEDIPLRISPGTVSISPGNDKLVLTFYGDRGSGSRTYEGKILFATVSGERVNMGLKVKARVKNIAEGGTWSGPKLFGLSVAGALILGGSALLLIRRRGIPFNR